MGLSLPPASAALPKDTAMDDEMAMPQEDFEQWMQGEEFQNMMNDESLRDINLDDLFTPDELANPNQMFTFTGTSIPEQQPLPMDMDMNMLQTPATSSNMVPDTHEGPSFHPRIGWYFPAIKSSGTSTPVGQFPMVHEGYTPMSSMPASAIPSRAPSPPPSVAPPKPKGRKKYGPAAYLEEKAKGQIGAALGSSDTLPTRTTNAHPLRDRKIIPVNQTCVCSVKEALKIKRPKNAWILFRSAVSKQIIAQLGGVNDNQKVSKMAAEMWRNATPDVKKKFQDLQVIEKQRHEQMFPDYKYQPGQTSRNKFGSASCTCGAFENNLKALRERQGFEVDSAESSDAEEYVPSSSKRRQTAQAPPAPMTLNPLPDISSFGLPAGQQAQAMAHVESLKRKREAAANTADEPRAKRRSPRKSSQAVTYTEPDDLEDFDPLAGMDLPKARPSQAGLRLETSPTLSQAGFAVDSPARNTRSGRNSVVSMRETFDFGSPIKFNNDFDWETLFTESGLTAAAQETDIDEEIVVSSGRRTSSNGQESVEEIEAPTASLRRSSRSRKVSK